MDDRLFIPLLIATLVAFPARSRADDTRWESLRVYAFADSQSVAVAAPSCAPRTSGKSRSRPASASHQLRESDISN